MKMIEKMHNEREKLRALDSTWHLGLMMRTGLPFLSLYFDT